MDYCLLKCRPKRIGGSIGYDEHGWEKQRGSDRRIRSHRFKFSP